jgi:hypothetical protein
MASMGEILTHSDYVVNSNVFMFDKFFVGEEESTGTAGRGRFFGNRRRPGRLALDRPV